MSTLASKPFQDDGRAAVHGLRRALADILASVGADPSEPQEISRKYGLDKTLTWRIARVVREEDAWEAVQHIPRRPSIQLFVRAMSRAGATGQSVDALWSAVEQFERFVEVHSGDRETLEMMASSAAKRSATKRMENFRKAGFQANAAMWGVCTRVRIAMHMITPAAAGGGLLDITTISVLGDFRRLRPAVPWSVGSMTQWDRKPESMDIDPWSALDPAIAPGRVPLLREFCSEPTPEIHEVHDQPSLVRYVLREGPVGNTAAATIVLGWTNFAAGTAHQSYPGEKGEHGVHLTTPAEVSLNDLYIHRDLEFAFNPTAHVYSMLPGGPQYPEGGELAPLLPVPSDVSDLGAGPPETTTPELPRYSDMFAYAAKRLNFSPKDFQGYRHRLAYPPIPSMALLRHGLLPRQ